jgi:tripartite-type tricarboxylate transporter receptor subunit TctC
MRTMFRAAALLAVSSAIIGISAIASAQTFPSRPVTLVVPFPPGGVIDTTARVIEADLAKELGQPVVIENKGGSGGNIGTQYVARSQPDGHTILMVPNATVVMNPFTFKSYPIDPGKDLTGVGMVGETYLGLVVLANSPFNTVQDIVAAAKAKPGELRSYRRRIGAQHRRRIVEQEGWHQHYARAVSGGRTSLAKPAGRPHHHELRDDRRIHAVY